MAWALELDALSKSFGARTAVADLSLAVPKGTFLSLLGPSGCGKTTTLRMIGGFTVPSRGRIRINGVDVTEAPAYHRNIGFVFQHYALFPHMTVFDNIAFGLRMRHVPKTIMADRVARALTLVQLANLAQRYPGQLSGGEQQRVALARALVIEPDLLLLDEPLSNLDAKLRATMRSEIRALQRTLGISTVYVTHDQVEAQVMSDTVAVMSKGRIVQVGTPGDLYDRPRTQFVAEFTGDANILAGRVASRQGETLDVLLDGGGHVRALDPSGGATDNVRLCVRPERVRLRKTPIGLPNCLRGVLVEVVFMGATTRYQVRLGGELVKSDWPLERRSEVTTGETVFLEWGLEDSVVLSDGE